MTPPIALQSAATATLEDTLSGVERHLAALSEALCARDLTAIGTHAQGLQTTLARAVEQFSSAAQRGPVPEALRRRLASASGQVAAQRESLARATSALDRAIEVLMPRDGPACYSRAGANERPNLGGAIRA
jgi:hypothetical protein